MYVLTRRVTEWPYVRVSWYETLEEAIKALGEPQAYMTITELDPLGNRTRLIVAASVMAAGWAIPHDIDAETVQQIINAFPVNKQRQVRQLIGPAKR